MDDQVTLYIPVYNAERYLDRVIPAVMSQTYPIAEVLFVNDGCTDRSMKKLEKHLGGARYPARVVNHKTNKGLGAARNTGVRHCMTKYIASIDADVRPHPEWLGNIMARFTEENIVGVGGRLIEEHDVLPGDRWRKSHMEQSWGNREKRNPKFLFGSNTCFRRQTVIDAGMYDERAKTNGEDVYLSEKIHQTGKELVYTPKAECYHLRRDSIKSALRTAWRWRYFGNWEELNFRRTVKANRKNFRKCRRIFLRRDLIVNRCFANIHIDLIYPFYACYLDWDAYIKKDIRQANAK